MFIHLVIIQDLDEIKFNDTDYKQIWSPKIMQDTLVSLLSKVDGIINVFTISMLI